MTGVDPDYPAPPKKPDPPPQEPPGGVWQRIAKSPWSGRDLDEELKNRDRAVDPFGLWADLAGFGVEPSFGDEPSFAEPLLGAVPAHGGGPSDASQRLPVLVKLREGRSREDFLVFLDERLEDAVADIHRKPPRGLAESRFLTVSVPSKALGGLLLGWSEWVERYEVGQPLSLRQRPEPSAPQRQAAADRPDSLAAGPSDPQADQPADPSAVQQDGPQPAAACDPSPAADPPVLVGVIDDGLPFAHQRFRLPGAGGTRFAFFWDQAGSGPSPTGFGYGRAFSQAQMNGWMLTASRAGDVDEEAVYRLADYRGVRRQVTHGAHMADCAGGATPTEAPAAPLLAGVQLPYPSVADSSGLSVGWRALDALLFLLQCADTLGVRHRSATPSPLVVNLSFARAAGPHDGSSPFEEVVDELIRLRNRVAPFAVVLPAGNHYLARGHAAFDLGAGQQRSLSWKVQPEDRTPSFLEIWLPAGATGIGVSLTPPGGAPSPRTTLGTGHVLTRQGAVVAALLYPGSTALGAGQLAVLCLVPTWADPPRRPAPAGVWTVTIDNTGADSVPVKCWVERDDTVLGYPVRGRQSYLQDPLYQRFDAAGRVQQADQAGSLVRRAGSFNGFASGRRPLVAGGWDSSNGHTSAFSGGGDAATVPMARPTALVVADESPVRRGLLAAKSCSSGVVALSGTSAAAAQLTRWTAQQMADKAPFDRAAVAAQAVEDEAQPDFPPPFDPPQRAGAGRIVTTTPSSQRR